MTVSVRWEKLELDESGAYNEAYLAQLRKELAEAGRQGRSVTVELVLDAAAAPPWLRERMDAFLSDEGLRTRYIEAAAHCRRRLKNCKNLEGWSLSCPLFGAGKDDPAAEAFTRRLMDRLEG